MSDQRRVILMGDSIGAMQGIPKGRGFMDRVVNELRAQDVEVLNWSVGGSMLGTLQLPTVKRKVEQAVANSKETIIVLELGGNDRLFGMPANQIEQSLEALVGAIKDAKATPVLMEVIPDGIDRDVAKRCGVRCINTPPKLHAAMKQPFKRGRIPEMAPTYIQEDGVHPNLLAQRHIAKTLLLGLNEELDLGMTVLSEEETSNCMKTVSSCHVQ